MKKHGIYALIVCAGMLLSGCEAVTGTAPGTAASPPQTTPVATAPQQTTSVKTEPPQVTEPAVPDDPLPDGDTIFLISESVNYAWGFQHSGVFLDTSGDIYRFQFLDDTVEDDMYFKTLDLFREYGSPVGHLNETQVSELYNIGKELNANASFRKEFQMYDCGQSTLYYFDSGSNRKIKCCSSGDYEEISTDVRANMFRDKWKAALGTITVNETENMMLLPQTENCFRDYPSAGLKLEGNYMLYDKRQLPILAEKCGVPIDNILKETDEFYAADAVFFVSLKKSSPPVGGIMKRGDAVDFVYFDGEEKPICHVAAFRQYDVVFSELNYTNFAGESWELLPDFDPNFDSRVVSGSTRGVSDEAIGKVYKEYKINNLWGLKIDNEDDYRNFVSYFDSIGLMEDRSSFADKLEERMKPDFDNYVLCIKLHRIYDDQSYKQERIRVINDRIDIGDKVLPYHSEYNGLVDGAAAWVWLPVDLLEAGKNYSVI